MQWDRKRQWLFITCNNRLFLKYPLLIQYSLHQNPDSFNYCFDSFEKFYVVLCQLQYQKKILVLYWLWYFLQAYFSRVWTLFWRVHNSPAHFPNLLGDTSLPLPSSQTLIPAGSRNTEHRDSQAAVTAPRHNSGVSTARNTASPLDDILVPLGPPPGRLTFKRPR